MSSSIGITLLSFRQQLPDLAAWRHYDRCNQEEVDIPALIKGFSEFYNFMEPKLWSAAVISLLTLRERFQERANIQLCEIHLSRAASKSIDGWGRKHDIHFSANEALIKFFMTHGDLGLTPSQRAHVSQFLQSALRESPTPKNVMRALIQQGAPEILARAGLLSAIPELAREVGIHELTYPNWERFPSIMRAYDKPLFAIMNNPSDLDVDIAAMRKHCGFIVYGNAQATLLQAKYDAAVTLLAFLSFIEGWRHLGTNPPVRSVR